MESKDTKSNNVKPVFGHTIVGKLVTLNPSEYPDKTGKIIHRQRLTISQGDTKQEVVIDDREGPMPVVELWKDYCVHITFVTANQRQEVTYYGDIEPI